MMTEWHQLFSFCITEGKSVCRGLEAGLWSNTTWNVPHRDGCRRGSGWTRIGLTSIEMAHQRDIVGSCWFVFLFPIGAVCLQNGPWGRERFQSACPSNCGSSTPGAARCRLAAQFKVTKGRRKATLLPTMRQYEFRNQRKPEPRLR
jgi:hypothetical protein